MLDLENLPDKAPAQPSVPSKLPSASKGLNLDSLPDSYANDLSAQYFRDGIAPDNYAKNKKLAVNSGLPEGNVIRNPFQAELTANEPDWKNVSAASPIVAKAMMENPDLFHMGKDDTDNLSWWQSGLKKAGEAFKYIVSAPNTEKTLGKTLTDVLAPAGERGFRTLVKGNADQNIAASLQILDTISKIESGELKTDADIQKNSKYASLFVGVNRRPERLAEFKKAYQQKLAQSALDSLQQTKALRSESLQPSQELARFTAAQGWVDSLSAVASNPQVIPELMAQSFGTMAPALPIIALSGGTMGVPALMATTGAASALTEYATSFSEVFNDLKIDINNIEAARAAVTSPEFAKRMQQKLVKAGVIGTMDALSGGTLGKTLAPKMILGKALSTGQREAVNIASQTAVQMAAGGGGEVLGALAAGEEIQPSAVIGEMISELPSAAFDIFTVNAAQATKETTRVNEAIQASDKLVELLKKATESKLRTRSPETFSQIVQQIADSTEGAVTEVYISAETLSQTLQEANIPESEIFAQMPSVMMQYQDALDTKSTIAIPISELLTKVAGTKLEPLLVPHIRDSDDINALSRAEAEAASGKAQEYLQQMAQFVLQEATNTQQLQASAEVVKSNIAAELKAANRFTADVNDSYANTVRDFYTVLAGDLKITPEQLWEGGWTDATGKTQAPFKLSFRAEGVPGAEAFNQNINQALQDRVDTDFAGVVAEYAALPDAKGGQVINTDLARELSPEYRGDRSRAAEVQDAASSFTKRLYEARLAAPTPAGKVPTVVFTAGGTGAGKSSVGATTGALMNTADIVYDTTMSSFESGDKKIQQALTSGRNVTIAYVYRDPVEALSGGALPRAMRDGRTAPLKVLQESHIGARKVIDELAKKYANDERVSIIAIDNSRGAGNAQIIALDKIPQISNTGLKEKLNEALENARAQGTISDKIYRATAGLPAASDAQGVVGGAGQRVSERVEQRDLKDRVDTALDNIPVAPDATLDDFTAENLSNLLSKNNWAVLTAANPDAVAQTEEQNAALNAQLEQDLQDMGLEYLSSVGRYDNVEPGFIVVGITEAQAKELGAKYMQDSVLTRRGLLYRDGRQTPATGVSLFETAPENYYTEVPGTGAFFSIDLDFAATTEAQLGSYNQAKAKAQQPTSTASLPQTLTANTAVDIRNGETLTGKQSLSVAQVGGYFDSVTGLRDYGDPVEYARALDTLVKELRYQMQQEKNGLDWYEEDIGAAFAETQKLIPELESPAQRQLFSVMAGILSPQTNARDNWFIAAQAFRSYKDTKTVPARNPATGSLWQGGTTSANKEKALKFLDGIIQDLGEEKAIEWLFSEHTVKELNAARKKWGNMGPGVDGKATDTALGLRAFGPKVGPFVMNINGIHEITVDMWATRTFNRLFGRMIGPDGKIVDAPTEAQRKIIKELFNEAAERVNIKGYQAQSVAWFFEQQLFNKLGTGAQSFGFSDGARRFTGEGTRDGGTVAGGQVSSGYAQAATSVTGYHFSNQKRTNLDGR